MAMNCDGFRVGVAVPVKNARAYVEEALRAIRGQTRRPDRMVVVDNGSVDGTVELLDGLKDELGFELLAESLPGASAARDKACRVLGDCDLIALCDADDVWGMNALEELLAPFRDDKAGDLVCVYCAYRIIDAAGVEKGRSPLPHMRGHIHGLVAQGMPILSSMTGTVVRRAVLEQVGGFDRALLSDEDVDVFIRLSGAGRFDFVPRHLVALRAHGKNTSRDYVRLLRSKAQIINKYPELYDVESVFVKTARSNFMHSDFARRSWLSRIFAAFAWPFIFGAAVRRNVSGRARTLLYPGFFRYSYWLAGRVHIFLTRRLRRTMP